MNGPPSAAKSNGESPAINSPRSRGRSSVEFIFDCEDDKEFFSRNGFREFDDFWNLPHVFVDEVNYRRGGWSGASRLEFDVDRSSHVYFVKRQENQFRYSLRHPFGRLTFEIEVDAIIRNRTLNLPNVETVCWGVKKFNGSNRAVVVTRAISDKCLGELIASSPDWKALLPVLTTCGEQLYQMHALGIRHGALYPNHIFLNPKTNTVQLIDFEGSRQCRRIKDALKPDMQQLVRRLDGMPSFAQDALLQPYRLNHAKALRDLR